jgi:choline dehydrogenase-like flavoprotein
MLVGSTDLGADDFFDDCVIGTGPAGTTLALRLEAAGRRVLLIEAGGLDYSDDSQAVYRGETVGDQYFDLDVTRLRYLGGSSNHWGGRCRPLDAEDFGAKSASEDLAWPIAKSELDPYLQDASDILEIGSFPADMPVEGGAFELAHFDLSPPISFATKYLDHLSRSERIFLLLNGYVTGLSTNGAAISGATLIDGAGTTRQVRARNYAVCCGGIENSRLLLWCNRSTNDQVVRWPKTLGRYWLEHPHATYGQALLTDGFTDRFMPQGTPVVFFSPTEEFMAANRILNCGLRVMDLRRQLRPRWKQSAYDLACAAPALARRLFSTVTGHRLACVAHLRAAWEQEPRPDNRVELADDADRFGVARARLHWKRSETDLRTIQTSAQAFAAFLARSDLGRAHLDPWVLGDGEFPDDDELAGNHHMGGTRMAWGPERGVVDANLKVFGQENLFVAGSSVFPSGGHANPTLTIVQLSLRLGDRLATAH